MGFPGQQEVDNMVVSAERILMAAAVALCFPAIAEATTYIRGVAVPGPTAGASLPVLVIAGAYLAYRRFRKPSEPNG